MEIEKVKCRCSCHTGSEIKHVEPCCYDGWIEFPKLTPFPVKSQRDWTEDFSHENGNYINNCVVCKDQFFGHKRRVVCKICFEKPEL